MTSTSFANVCDKYNSQAKGDRERFSLATDRTLAVTLGNEEFVYIKVCDYGR
jgi:hypothetical protein